MKTRELQKLLDEQPPVSSSTFAVGLLTVLSILLAAFFLILGLGLFVEHYFSVKIFLNWVSKQLNIVLNDEQRLTIALSFGIISLILSGIFAGFFWMSKMILRRNHFILQMEDWIYANILEVSRRKRTKN